ncbi:sulfatase-like hydrolase/transferase [Candidatus Saccharibacteria bacterium]|nr:sulfatase-like hydrolase/transferase [Candidatus Saccharibacteria bacterium]
MLLVSLLSTIATTDALKPKEFTPIATTKNLNLVSNNNNYLILLVDAVDSTHFNKIVSNSKDYQRIFKDFSYFPDTLSGYAFTRDSVPFIFSGEWNENQTSFSEYSTNAFNNSKFFAKLAEEGYNRNFYNYDFVWNDTKSLEFSNTIPLERIVQKKPLLKQEAKFFLYKALPFPLKFLSKIETLDFSLAQAPQKGEPYSWNDVNFYTQYLEHPLTKTDQNYFQYIHIEGAHVPFNLDSNVTLLPDTEEGTYEDKIESTIKIIDKYLARLKNSDAYNNSTIIILADHGFNIDGTNRANPILYIKGKSEKHDKMVVSDKQISYADLYNGFIELLDNKSSTEIFKDIPTEGRIRRYLYNGFNEEEHMYEYEQTGHAWEADKLKPTGREFDL